MNGGNQLSHRPHLCYQEHHKVRANGLVLNDLQHRYIISFARVRRKRRVRMPFTKVVETSVIMPSLLEECAQPPYGIFDPSHKRSECSAPMNGHIPDDEKVWPGMLTHQDSTDLTPSRLPESR